MTKKTAINDRFRKSWHSTSDSIPDNTAIPLIRSQSCCLKLFVEKWRLNEIYWKNLKVTILQGKRHALNREGTDPRHCNRHN